MIFAKREDIIERKIHTSFFLIDIRDNYKEDSCAIYEINETGKFIWDSIDGEKSIEEVAKLLKAAISEDIDIKILSDDIEVYLARLRAKGFIVEVK